MLQVQPNSLVELSTYHLSLSSRFLVTLWYSRPRIILWCDHSTSDPKLCRAHIKGPGRPLSRDTGASSSQVPLSHSRSPFTAIDDTMMHPLNTVATQVTIGTEKINKAINHFMDYCASNPDAVKLYRACDMILMIHSDAAYLVEPEARSRAGGFFYLCNKDG